MTAHPPSVPQVEILEASTGTEQNGKAFIPAAGSSTGKVQRKPVYHKTPCSLPDFRRLNNRLQKKMLFFNYLRPIVKKENERISKKRDTLAELFARHQRGERLSRKQKQYLDRLAKEYRLKTGSSLRKYPWHELLKRVDIIPIPLVLIQAAHESAWGTSRFARQGNNLFGQRCFSAACGIVPKRRRAGATFEVASYASVQASVRSYLGNLNTGSAYTLFREKRYRLRLSGQTLDCHVLAGGLDRYSERGQDYVEKIRDMLSNNQKLLKASLPDQTG